MPDQRPRTRWGGVADRMFPARGYFVVGERDGIFWLIDPDGGRFLSKGVNTVRLDQDRVQNSDRFPYAEACQKKYGGQDRWRAAAAGRIRQWGFNTLGAWSDQAVAKTCDLPLALTPNLDLGASFASADENPTNGKLRQSFPDVFDPAFDRHIRHRAQVLCGPQRDNQAVLGWFIDNELQWAPDWRGSDELLTRFISLPLRSPGRLAALGWLRRRYSDFQDFNTIWRSPVASWGAFALLARIGPPYRRRPPYERNAGDEDVANRADGRRAGFAADCDAFAALVAERYFALTCAAVRAADPHHLLLGCRFAYVPAPGVIDAAARHNDVISFNCYELDPSKTVDAYAARGKPCLIGEFSFRGLDSGLPNTNGAGPLVATQAQRATCLQNYVTSAVREPGLVGYHWFEHADQPAEGRFDGENSNFGIVIIDDRVYEDLAQTVTSVNREAEQLHASVPIA